MIWLNRNRAAICVILAICFILILPVVIYQYPYPNHSDDFPRHLSVIQRVVDGQGYSDLWYSRNAYAGPAFTGLIIKALHTDPYYTFYVLHYLALVVMVLSIWYFSRKVFNRTAANLALPFVVLCTPPFLQYFYNGVIFNMVNLFIFGLMALLALVIWLRTWRTYYAAISIMLFAIATIYHSASGLYLFAGIILYMAAVIAVNLKNKAWSTVRRLVIYVLALGIVCGALGLTLAPEWRVLLGMATDSVSGVVTATPQMLVSVSSFLTGYSNIAIVALLFISMVYIWRRKVALCAGPGVLSALILVLALAVFVFKFAEPTRAAHDLAMVISIAAAGAVGIALERFQLQFKRNYISIAVAAMCIAMALPMTRFWFDYQCAVRPADQEAIAALEELQGQTYSVSTQVQPSIYSIFLQGKTYTPAGGDYIVFRDNPMTKECDPHDVWCQIKGDISQEADYSGLSVVAEFNDSEVRIVIYKGG